MEPEHPDSPITKQVRVAMVEVTVNEEPDPDIIDPDYLDPQLVEEGYDKEFAARSVQCLLCH